MNRTPTDALHELIEGNQRFASGQSLHRVYSRIDLQRLHSRPEPIAAVVACSDSRVAPEILFDQPLGALLVSRTPGNVIDDSVRWMAELAMGVFRLPLVLVVGHAGCLAVRQAIAGEGESGVDLRQPIVQAYAGPHDDISEYGIEEAIKTHATMVARAMASIGPWISEPVESGVTAVRAAWYDGPNGRISLLDA